TEPQLEGGFISLADAAKKTGYHQDYLGQLARGGKLEAQKIGRNWVTTQAALDKFLGRDQKEIKEPQETVLKTATAVPDAHAVEPKVPAIQEQAEKNTEPSSPVGIKVFSTARQAGPNLQ